MSVHVQVFPEGDDQPSARTYTVGGGAEYVTLTLGALAIFAGTRADAITLLTAWLDAVHAIPEEAGQ